MAHKRKSNTTMLEIIQVASRMFLEQGYSKTTVKAMAVCLELATLAVACEEDERISLPKISLCFSGIDGITIAVK